MASDPTPAGPVIDSDLLGRVRSGSRDAVATLDRLMRPRVHGFVRERMGEPLSGITPQDVVNAVLLDLYAGLSGGKYPDLRDEQSLWWLLADIARKRVATAYRKSRRAGRGFRHPHRVEELGDRLVAHGPGPAVEAALRLLRTELLGLLDPVLQQVAELRLDGLSIDEIARALGFSSRSVNVALRSIRQRWKSHLAAEGREDSPDRGDAEGGSP